MAGRIYGLPGEPGVRDGSGCRIFTWNGIRIPMPVRVEFDRDADEGLATVTSFITAADNSPVVDYENNQVCRATYRTWVQLVHRGQPDPAPTPNRTLWKQKDGSVIPDADPVPQIPFTEAASA